MNISDATLSAFLDGELPPAEMDAVRQQLAADPALGDRLAALAEVDQLVARSCARIDDQPLPASVQALLGQSAPGTAQVIRLPLRHRVQQQLQQHLALAASVALALGFGLAQLLPDQAPDPWAGVAQGLEAAPSGVDWTLPEGGRLRPQLTFVSQQGDYCRQYRVSSAEQASEQIACRVGGQWRLAASVQLNALPQPDAYRTATGGALLDAALDRMQAGEPLDTHAEAQVIARQWQVTESH